MPLTQHLKFLLIQSIGPWPIINLIIKTKKIPFNNSILKKGKKRCELISLEYEEVCIHTHTRLSCPVK